VVGGVVTHRLQLGISGAGVPRNGAALQPVTLDRRPGRPQHAAAAHLNEGSDHGQTLGIVQAERGAVVMEKVPVQVQVQVQVQGEGEGEGE